MLSAISRCFFSSNCDVDRVSPVSEGATAGTHNVARYIVKVEGNQAVLLAHGAAQLAEASPSSSGDERERAALSEHFSAQECELAYPHLQGCCCEQKALLIGAAWLGKWQTIQDLLNKGIAPEILNGRDHQGKTALIQAISAYRPEIVKALVHMPGIDVNIADHEGNTPLHYATALGHSDFVKILLENSNINVDATNKNKETPLNVAASDIYADIVEMLLPSRSNTDDAAQLEEQASLIPERVGICQRMIKVFRKKELPSDLIPLITLTALDRDMHSDQSIEEQANMGE